MKPRPKLRTFCRWMLTILTVLLVVVWIGSRWYNIGCTPHFSPIGYGHVIPIEFENGQCGVSIVRDNRTRNGPIGITFEFDRSTQNAMYFWDWEYFNDGVWKFVVFPAWLPPLLLAVPTALMWRTHIIARRRKPGVCTKCGYDITGLVGKEACPECGTKFEVEIAPAKA